MQTHTPHTPWSQIFPTGNLPIAGAGKTIDQLLPGEIGIFNEVGISVSAAEIPVTPSVYFGIGASSIENVKKTRMIYRKSINTYNVQCYRAAQCKIQELQDVCASCDTTYVFRICYTSRRLDAIIGANPVQCVFPVQTSCCEGCEACPSGNCVELLKKAMDEINKSKMFIATMFAAADKGNLTATPLTEAQIAALDPTTAGFQCPVLRVTGCVDYLKRCCSLPGIEPDLLDFQLSWENDECCGTVVDLQEACFSTGEGRTICNQDVEAWLYSQPSVSLINGDGFPKCIDGQCDENERYNLLTIGSSTPSYGQLEHWENPYYTVIPIPCADSTTLASLAVFLDTYSAPCMFPPQAGVTCACPPLPLAAKAAVEAKTVLSSKDETVAKVNTELGNITGGSAL